MCVCVCVCVCVRERERERERLYFIHIKKIYISKILFEIFLDNKNNEVNYLKTI